MQICVSSFERSQPSVRPFLLLLCFLLETHFHVLISLHSILGFRLRYISVNNPHSINRFFLFCVCQHWCLTRELLMCLLQNPWALLMPRPGCSCCCFLSESTVWVEDGFEQKSFRANREHVWTSATPRCLVLISTLHLPPLVSCFFLILLPLFSCLFTYVPCTDPI